MEHLLAASARKDGHKWPGEDRKVCSSEERPFGIDVEIRGHHTELSVPARPGRHGEFRMVSPNP